MTSDRGGDPPKNSGFKNAFGEALEKLLTERKIPKKDLAAQLSVSPSYVSRVLSGAAPVSASNAVCFADALGLNAAETTAFVGSAVAGKSYTTGLICPHCGKPYDAPPKAG